MIELKFHRELYSGRAVDQAVKVFGPHGTFEMAEEPSYWVVRVTGASESRERRVALELGNYALGLTVQGRNGDEGNAGTPASPTRTS